MKKNNANDLRFVAEIWGKRILLPFSIRRYLGLILLLGGYIVFFNLPIEFNDGGGAFGAYAATVIIIWPLIVVAIAVIIHHYERKNDRYYIEILKDEGGVFYGIVRHKKWGYKLFFPFHCQYFFKKIILYNQSGFQVFILCTDRKGNQFILSTKWSYLLPDFKDASEITSIPPKWFKILCLACNQRYILHFFHQIVP